MQSPAELTFKANLKKAGAAYPKDRVVNNIATWRMKYAMQSERKISKTFQLIKRRRMGSDF